MKHPCSTMVGEVRTRAGSPHSDRGDTGFYLSMKHQGVVLVQGDLLTPSPGGLCTAGERAQGLAGSG